MNTALIAADTRSATVALPDHMFTTSLATWRDNPEVIESAMIYLALNVSPCAEDEVYFCSEHRDVTNETKDEFRTAMLAIADDLGLDLRFNVAFTDSDQANLMAIRRMPVVIAEALAQRQGDWDVIQSRPVRRESVQKMFVPEVFSSTGQPVPAPFWGWHRSRSDNARFMRM